MSVIRLGNPAIPVKVTETGTNWNTSGRRRGRMPNGTAIRSWKPTAS
jgi:hypothetical protein